MPNPGCPMCGRYLLRSVPGDIAERFNVPFVPDLTPRYNAAPRQTLPVVGAKKEGGRGLTLMRWGLVPSWSKGLPKVQPINARDDTVGTNGLFRTPFRKKRCLVPADGWYEWHYPSGKKGKGGQPYLFEVGGGQLFAFAGIWDAWKEGPTADLLFTFATLTTTPNAKAAEVHGRMPVVLPEKLWDQWLDPAFDDPDALRAMLGPVPETGLAIRPVNPKVGNVKFEGPDALLAPTALAAGPNPA